jgi:hypothetical protein
MKIKDGKLPKDFAKEFTTKKEYLILSLPPKVINAALQKNPPTRSSFTIVKCCWYKKRYCLRETKRGCHFSDSPFLCPMVKNKNIDIIFKACFVY